MSDLFKNAVASIRMGVEDYTQKDENRALSAVRNFYSGILLLAKEVLVRTTPQAAMQDILAAKYKPVPDGSHVTALDDYDGAKLADAISLSKHSVEFFKAHAARSKVSYQKMIRRLLDAYAAHYAARSEPHRPTGRRATPNVKP
jgi:hypothetical protein